MEENIKGNISRLKNNYSLLKFEFEHYEVGRSKFASREAILDLMIRTQNELRELQDIQNKKLTLNNKKNNSNE